MKATINKKVNTDFSNQVITVKTDAENPEPMELIAKSIIQIADALDAANNSKLKRRAVALLLRDVTGVGLTEIDQILNAAPLLRKHFIK